MFCQTKVRLFFGLLVYSPKTGGLRAVFRCQRGPRSAVRRSAPLRPGAQRSGPKASGTRPEVITGLIAIYELSIYGTTAGPCSGPDTNDEAIPHHARAARAGPKMGLEGKRGALRALLCRPPERRRHHSRRTHPFRRPSGGGGTGRRKSLRDTAGPARGGVRPHLMRRLYSRGGRVWTGKARGDEIGHSGYQADRRPPPASG